MFTLIFSLILFFNTSNRVSSLFSQLSDNSQFCNLYQHNIYLCSHFPFLRNLTTWILSSIFNWDLLQTFYLFFFWTMIFFIYEHNFSDLSVGGSALQYTIVLSLSLTLSLFHISFLYSLNISLSHSLTISLSYTLTRSHYQTLSL